ncbi:hypothetical protein SDJN02_12442, partial [Cucurbita argyrosperma subsp. argyrosperma]
MDSSSLSYRHGTATSPIWPSLPSADARIQFRAAALEYRNCLHRLHQN